MIRDPRIKTETDWGSESDVTQKKSSKEIGPGQTNIKNLRMGQGYNHRESGPWILNSDRRYKFYVSGDGKLKFNKSRTKVRILNLSLRLDIDLL